METEQDWTVWCKSKPKEPKEVSQTFRAFDRCIFTGQKNAKSSKKGKRHQGNDGGKHVLRKRGRVVETRRYLNMPSYRKHGLLDAPLNTDVNQGVEALKNAWEHESKKDELRVDLQVLERDFWLGSVTMLMAPQKQRTGSPLGSPLGSPFGRRGDENYVERVHMAARERVTSQLPRRVTPIGAQHDV